FIGIPFGLALWAIALGVLIFIRDRPKKEKIYLFAISVISTLAALSLLPTNFFQSSLSWSHILIQIGLLTILGGAISLIVTILYQLFSKLFSKK
ncbi:MAG: hypothetical protein F6K35_22700, partial [Okeania sp. SIO2H7]|nr:hypothetical protein [Okeania sp. SIO2H7]